MLLCLLDPRVRHLPPVLLEPAVAPPPHNLRDAGKRAQALDHHVGPLLEPHRRGDGHGGAAEDVDGQAGKSIALAVDETVRGRLGRWQAQCRAQLQGGLEPVANELAKVAMSDERRLFRCGQ